MKFAYCDVDWIVCLILLEITFYNQSHCTDSRARNIISLNANFCRGHEMISVEIAWRKESLTIVQLQQHKIRSRNQVDMIST